LRDPQAIEKSISLCAQYFELLDQVLSEQPFLGGERLSLADITVGTHLYRYFSLGISRPLIPHVEAWYQRLREREAYREHVMIPFEELFGRLDY